MTKAINTTALIILFAIITIKSNGQTNWVLGGNSPTGTDTLGNITNQDLKIITNNKMQMTIKKTGKVGIGNAAPIFKLDVKSGSINTDSLYRINGVQVINRDASNNIQIGDITAKVGIGTATPTARLNIVSDAAADAYLKSNAGGAKVIIDRGSQDSVAIIEFRTQGGSGFADTWQAGVVNPGLNGDFVIIRSGGAVHDTAFSILKSTGNIGIGGHPSASKKLLVTGDAEIIGTVRNNGEIINGIVSASGITVNGLSITGGAPANGLVLTSNGSGGTSWLPSAGGGSITGGGATNRVAFWKNGTSLSSSTNLYWDSLNFRLGLGTSTPNATLDINGDIKISGGNPVPGKVLTCDNVNGQASWQTISGGGVLSGSGTASKLAFWDGTFTLNANTTLSWDNTNTRLGVGTATPTATLEVNGQIKITGGSPGTGKVLTSNASGLASWTTPLSGSGTGGALAYWNGSAAIAGNIDLYWNNSNSRFGIGTVIPNAKLHIDGGTDASYASGSGYMVIGAYSGLNIVFDNNEIVARNNGATSTLYLNTNGGNLIYNTGSAAGNMGIGTSSPGQKLTVANGTSTGTYTTTGWIHVSDARLKTNIKHLTGSLDKIMKLNGVSYNWKNIPNDNNQIGFIAQEVEKIFPEVIVKDKDGSYGMASQNLVAPIVEAIKEQQELIVQKEVAIKSLQLTVGSLQNENEKQQQQIEDLKKQMQQFENALSQCCTSFEQKKSLANEGDAAKLEQNIPNPFSETTVIRFFIPKNTTSAALKIYSLDGAELKSFINLSKGLGSVEISGKTFAAGTYTYMLIVNGKVMDTKQMILSK